MTIVQVILLSIVSYYGAFVPGTYTHETTSFAVQGMGQDVFNLFFAAPILLISHVFMLRENKFAVFIFGGTVFYILYSFVIYSFGVHFNQLFLLYCLILGASFYTFILFIYQGKEFIQRQVIMECVPVRAMGIYFLVIALLFYMLWLKDILPAIFGDFVPPDIIENELLVNPIHVLDIAIVLPGLIITSIQVMRRHPLGLLLAPVLLVFVLLLAMALVAMVIMLNLKDIAEDASVAFVFVALALISMVFLYWFLRNLKTSKQIPFYLFVVAAIPASAQVIHFEAPGYESIPIMEDGHWHVLVEDLNDDSYEDLYITREAQDDIMFYGNPDGTFTEVNITGKPWNNRIGSMGIVYSDLNNDGLNDILIARSPYQGGMAEGSGAKDVILKNLGAGNFENASSNLPTDFFNIIISDMDAVNYTTGVATGYFNADSIPDIVMVNGGISYLPTLDLFTPAIAIIPEKLYNDLYFSQNKDTDDDGIDNYILGPSDSPVIQYKDMSTDVVTADFDNDGWDDIFISNFHDASIFAVMRLGDSSAYCKIYMNDLINPGNFTWSISSFPLLKYPATSADAADFDNDGDIDLVVGMERRGDTLFAQQYSIAMTSRIFINDGSGNFTDSTQWKFPPFKKEYTSCYDIHFVDLNSDGALDVFGAGIHNFLFIQDPHTKTFADSAHLLPTFPAHPDKNISHTFHSYGAGFGDFDDNGEKDIFLADTYEQPRLQFQLGNGGWIDTTTTNLPPDGENSDYCVIADFNGDELPDIAKVNNGNINSHALYIRSGIIGNYPYFRDLGMQIPLDTNYIRNYGIDAHDIDADGDCDLLISGKSGVMLFENVGAGNFFENTTWLESIQQLENATRVKFADINSDGYKDIFVPRAQDHITGLSNRILLWDSFSGKYDDNSSNLLPFNSRASIDFDMADINGDNWMDFVVANEQGSALYLSAGGGMYSITTPFALTGARSIKFAQLDSDNLPDVIEVNKIREDKALIYRHDGTSAPYGASFISVPQSEGETLDIGIYDFNADGLNDVVIPQFHKSTKIYLNQGNMVFADSSAIYLPDSLYLVNSVKAIKFTDMNNDGLTDMYFARDNQDLLLYGQGIATGINEHEWNYDQKVTVFPNPSTGKVTFEITENGVENYKLFVYDISGQFIKSFENFSNSIAIDTSGFTKGLYFFQFRKVTDNKVAAQGKFIIQ